jgi:molecular chaperone GrpE (heat shock protein)
MGKKSKSKKSKAKKAKLESPETESQITNETAAPSWSTDDVYTLLKAVNEVTLKRMENKTDAIQTSANNVFNYVTDIQAKVAKVQNVLDQLIQQVLPGIEQRTRADLARINNWVNSILASVQSIDGQVLPRIEQEVQAIKAKTDRLP